MKKIVYLALVMFVLVVGSVTAEPDTQIVGGDAVAGMTCGAWHLYIMPSTGQPAQSPFGFVMQQDCTNSAGVQYSCLTSIGADGPHYTVCDAKP